MAEGLEHVSNLITRYAIFENLYLQVDSDVKDQLADAIVRLYTAILTYLSKASRYYNLNTGGSSRTNLTSRTKKADQIVRAHREKCNTYCRCGCRFVPSQNLG